MEKSISLFNKEDFADKASLQKFLFENKAALKVQKKAQMKCADAISVLMPSQSNHVNKAQTDSNKILVKAVINTTNLLDSHDDVHLPGIWNKSLNENKNILHLQEHIMKYQNIISKDVNAKAEKYKWKELGFDFNGTTEALVFESTIKAEKNPYMFKLYKDGEVDNHSVGMQYVKIDLALDNPDYPNEYSAWEKYLPEIANKETAEAQGFFWYVQEAKVIEGSAVVLGSNYVTPTLSVEPISTQNEPQKITPDELKSFLNNELKNLLK